MTLSCPASLTDAAAMWFAHFWRHLKPHGEDEQLSRSRDWRDSGLADEVEAFLSGRLAEQFAGAGQAVPAWAVLNRLAHADRSELVRVVEGGGVDRLGHPSSGQPPWAPAERFVAGHLLARAATPEQLTHVQQTALVPVELLLIERSKTDRLTADQVLETGAEALDTLHPGQ